MAGPIYGQGYIDLSPQLSQGFLPALNTSLAPIASKLGAMLKTPIGLGITAGIGLALAGLKLGGEFDEAFDTIRVGTGATGEALAGLEEDFRAVFGSVPTSMGPAATAIADLNRRLGLTGTPLQDLAGQFLELSRITGTDLSTNIAEVTRVFGDWSIATDQQQGSLDTLFRASQATGTSVDQLAGHLVRYGAPFRQLGFSFEEAATLIGKFEKEGVNTELVLGSLRIALGKMARDGEDAQTTFQRITEEIANAGSASEANALALELFGARAGPDMAAAIREGRFEIGELFATVAGGSETVLGAAADTADWQESMQLLGNNLKLIFEPLATGVFKVVGEAVGKLAEWITGLRTAIADPSSGLGQTFRTMGAIFSEVGAVIGSVIDAVMVIWDRWGEQIMAAVSFVWGGIQGVIEPVLHTIKGLIELITGLITLDWSRAWEGIKGILSGVWESLEGIVRRPIEAIQRVIGGALDTIKEAWDRIWGGLASAAETFLNAVVSAVKTPINAILGLLETLINGALRGLQLAIDTADVLAGPWINFPDEVFSPVRLPRVHMGGLQTDESLAVLQAGELVVPSSLTQRLLDQLEKVADDSPPARIGGVFDGATLVFQGTPDTLADKIGRRVGWEVRLA